AVNLADRMIDFSLEGGGRRPARVGKTSRDRSRREESRGTPRSQDGAGMSVRQQLLQGLIPKEGERKEQKDPARPTLRLKKTGNGSAKPKSKTGSKAKSDKAGGKPAARKKSSQSPKKKK
ncbi:MAG: hypothetical protein ACRC9T_05995, partial [Vibrionaceae bacterium]